MAITKEDKKRIKELEKEYGDYLLSVKPNSLDGYIRAIEQVLTARDCPAWTSNLSWCRCVGSYVNGNVVTYDIRAPDDSPMSVVFTYLPAGEGVDVFWNLRGAKQMAGMVKRGFGINFLENLKEVHFQCEANLVANPPPPPVPRIIQDKPPNRVSRRNVDELMSKSDKIILSKGLNLMQNKLFNEAIRCFNQVLESNPDNAQLFMLKAATCVNGERFGEALEAANRGLQLDPNDEAMLSIRAMALSRVGDSGDALKAFDEVTKRHPESKQGWINLANFYTGIMQGRGGGMAMDMLIINALEKAVSLDPEDVASRTRLALLYNKYNDFSHTSIHLEQVARFNPDLKIQAFLQETQQKIAQGLSRPFSDTLKKDIETTVGHPIQTLAPAPSAEQICPNCGEKLPLKAKFCNKCGQKIP